MSSYQPRSPYARQACGVCQKAKTRCLPSPGSTGSCKRCVGLGKECVFDQVRKTKRSKAPTEDTIQMPHSPETSHCILITTQKQATDSVPNPSQSTSYHPSALRLVPVLSDVVATSFHDVELDEGIHRARIFFQGEFDSEVFWTDLNEAARQSDPSHPYIVRSCHWAIILRQPRIHNMLKGANVAEKFTLEIVAALFSEVKKPTLWTLKATMILLDHFRTVEDVRYNYVKAIAHEMVDNSSCYGSLGGEGQRIARLSSVLRVQFPSSPMTSQETRGVSVTRQNADTARTSSFPSRPIDGLQNIQLEVQGDGRNSPLAARSDKAQDLASGQRNIDQVLLSLDYSWLPSFGYTTTDLDTFFSDNTVNGDGIAE